MLYVSVGSVLVVKFVAATVMAVCTSAGAILQASEAPFPALDRQAGERHRQ